MRRTNLSLSTSRVSESASPACQQALPTRLQLFWRSNARANPRKTKTRFASNAGARASISDRILDIIRDREPAGRTCTIGTEFRYAVCGCLLPSVLRDPLELLSKHSGRVRRHALTNFLSGH